jgi:Tol biopolymer transport system component
MKMFIFADKNIGGDQMSNVFLRMMSLLLVVLIVNCGGPKKLTQEEYNQLSPQERVTYLEKYVKKNSNDLDAKKSLYNEYLALNMPEKAIPLMESILKQDPYQPDLQFQYGELLMSQGDTKGAYRAFRETLRAPGGSAFTDQVGRYLGGKFAIQQVTSSPADETFPVFSPDGNKIIYQTNENGNWDIIERDLASGETRFLVNTAASEELPCLSPDGKKMAFTTNADDRRPIDDKFKVREIYLLDFDTNILKNLTESVADDWLPRFSHRGDLITFVSERGDLRSVPYTEKYSDIFRMESDGDFHLQLTDDDANDGGAGFNITDDRIYFHSNKNGSYDLFVMKTDGTLPMTLIGNPESNEVNPFVSPDSQYITFFGDQSGSFDIYRARIDGREVERLTVNPANNTNPVYSPDGNFIAYHSDQNGNYDIFILNLQVVSEPTTQELIMRLEHLIGP